ncbi:MAG TPA: serine hydrolase domain-containing protein [Candidatus Acidoferrales bacterium]|nr:serine hydrolase domain-containing protein [Candidatus Acidoferrales bacterium]
MDTASASGFDTGRLGRLSQTIEQDVAAERYDGCELVVGRGGTVVYHQHFGWADRAAGRRVEKNQPFITMSIGKQFVVALVLNRIERGALALTTPVAEVIPEFGARGKARITIAQMLTHTAGMPAMLPPIPPELVGNLEAVVAATCAALPECLPGQRVNYSAIVAHAVLAEVVRRLDGRTRSFRQIVDEDLFKPLGMQHSSLGVRRDLASRLAPVVARDRRRGLFEPEMLEMFGGTINEESEIPAGGYVSTAADVFRFAEMLRRGGALDGVRILSPPMLELIQTNHTGDRPNSLWDYTYDMRGWEPFPAYLGLGFFLRGEGIHPTPFGTLASPRTFGGLGAGSNVFWIDPVRDLSYAFLSSGLMEDSYSVERHQRLSDLVFAALVE